VHQAFADILRFWFDRGVAGFRIDVAHGLYKDAQLRDDPPAPEGELVRGRFGLAQVYSANRPESHGVFRDWRKIAESYPVPRVLLGETWVGDLDALAAFHGQGDELQLTFNFPFIFSPFTAEALAAVVAESLAKLPAGECAIWTSSNHDISRFPTRWCGGDERRVRLGLLMLATLPGALVLYYGDELGMTDVDVPAELLRDKMRAEEGARESRDRSRTPMRWDSSPSGGFTGDGVQPWLPYGNAAGGSVADQQADPSSILHLCRDLLALRRREFAGQLASFEQLAAPAGVWVYETGGLTVAANFSAEPATLNAPPGAVLLATGEGALDGLVLQPWAGVIARSLV
jgi:alpha-glucosidase